MSVPAPASLSKTQAAELAAFRTLLRGWGIPTTRVAPTWTVPGRGPRARHVLLRATGWAAVPANLGAHLRDGRWVGAGHVQGRLHVTARLRTLSVTITVHARGMAG